MELLTFLGLFVSTTDSVLEDGKVSTLELARYFDALLAAKPAIEGIKSIPAELKDLDPEEREGLVGVLARALSLRNQEVEGLVEEGFDLTLRLSNFVLKVGAARRAPVES